MEWIEKSVTRDHCSALRGLPRDADSDPRDRFFYPHHTPLKNTYIHHVCLSYFFCHLNICTVCTDVIYFFSSNSQ